MKIKLEIKSSDAGRALFTIFMEDEQRRIAKFLITRYNVHQLKIGDTSAMKESENIPISDGVLTMDKEHLKEFIASLQCLLKSMNAKPKTKQ